MTYKKNTQRYEDRKQERCPLKTNFQDYDQRKENRTNSKKIGTHLKRMNRQVLNK